MTINVEERLAAKADGANLRTAIAESGNRVAQRIIESETRVARLIAELRAEVAKSQTETTRLMIIGGFIIVAITLLNRLLG